MSEHLDEQRIELGLEQAHLANSAFDEVREAENTTRALGIVRRLVSVTVEDGADEKLQADRDRAQAHFDRFVTAAGALIGRDSEVSDTLFGSPNVVEPVNVPESLKGLDERYRDTVVSRFATTSANVERHIKAGTLPAGFERPDLDQLAERVVALAPTYEAFRQRNWQPEVVFVPLGLSFAQKSELLKGHQLPNGAKTEGAYRTWTGYEDSLVDPTGSKPEDDQWDVAIVVASDRPPLVNVSPDGANGRKAAETIGTLKDLRQELGLVEQHPAEDEEGYTDEELLVAQFSPDEDTYDALQANLLERGQAPVDPETWTIGKENVTVDDVLGSVYLDFSPGYRKVGSNWGNRDRAVGGGGVRPSVRGKDLILESKS